MKLYEISQECAALFSQMENLDNSGDQSEEALDEMDRLQNQFGELHEKFEHKAEDVAKYVCNLTGEIAIIEAEYQRLQARKKTRQNRIEWLKRYLLDNMETLGISKVSTDLFTINSQNNPVSMIIDDESEIPVEYKVATIVLPLKDVPAEFLPIATVSINKDALKTTLKSTEETIPGVTLKQSKHIRIR